MLDELKRLAEKDAVTYGGKDNPIGKYAKITPAAIEGAQRYKKDENGLLPCPFCSKQARAWKQGLVRKQLCACSDDLCGAYFGNFTPEEWNTRADNAAVRAVLEVTGGGE